MKKQKKGFNIIDALIIILVVAVGVGVYFVFFNGKENAADVGETVGEPVNVKYVLQVRQLSSEYSDNIEVGQNVIDYGTHTDAGVVSKVDYENYVYVGHNKETGAQVLTTVDDSVNLYITVEGEAVLSNETYYVNDTSLYIGKRLDMMMPELFCSGYVVSLEVTE